MESVLTPDSVMTALKRPQDTICVAELVPDVRKQSYVNLNSELKRNGQPDMVGCGSMCLYCNPSTQETEA